nr:BPK_HP1_G0043850.mRNA.1.CDS.1 [Saccharomyces cerevisiae]
MLSKSVLEEQKPSMELINDKVLQKIIMMRKQTQKERTKLKQKRKAVKKLQQQKTEKKITEGSSAASNTKKA